MPIFYAMLLAFILSLFGADDMFTNALSSIFNRAMSSDIYWFLFFVIGLVYWVKS